MNYCLLSLVVFELILENFLISCYINSDIRNYYNSETVSSFKNQWEPIRKSYENALKTALIENFGRKSMNTIERRTDNALRISRGFYLYDNVVHVVFHGLSLKEMPHVKNPEINFYLADNVLLLQAELSKMIIETKYSLMRNNSDVLFAGTNFDPNSNSPFALQQVKDIGCLAILVEDCILSGFVISKLIGQTIVLGHDTFRIRDCKFTIEISAVGLGAPPVIAPYFSIEQRGLLENLMAKPIREELLSKLQAALYSFVNTSIFEKDLLKFRKDQQLVFKETSKFVINSIRNANKEKMETNKASYDLEPLDIIWNATINGHSQVRSIKLSDIVVDGFDSAYSPLIGGPYMLQSVGIAETQRYNNLKVKGKIFFEHDGSQIEHDFSMELLDVCSGINKDLEDNSQVFDVDTNIFWRDTEFSITNVENASERITAESIANGLLINEVPKLLNNKLSKLKKDGDYQKTQLSMNDKNLGLEHLSDLSANELYRKEEILTLDIVPSSEELNRIDEEEQSNNDDDLNDDSEKSPKAISVAFLSSNEKSLEHKPADVDNEQILTDGGRRKHKQRNKKRKRHGKRHQDKSGRSKKAKKHKKKVHSQ